MQIRHLAALLLALLALAIPMPVAADCQGPDSIEEALATTRVAFVGTVVATREDAPGAAFQVEEIWVGDVPALAEIHGMFGNDQWAEDDRRFEAGARYLVIPYRGDDGLLHDHICTGTTPWRAKLAELRPPDAQLLGPRPSSAAEQAASPPPTSLLIAAVAAALVIGIGLAAFTRAGRTPEG